MAAASSQSPPAMAALRRIGTNLLRRLAPKPQKRALCFVKNKSGIWILEDICLKESRYEKLKEKMSPEWGKVAERAKDIVLENVIRSAVLTIWGAGVFSVTKPLEKLGIVDTGISNNTKQKEEIAAMVKVETEATLEKLRQERAEDRMALDKLSKDFNSQKELVKLILDKAKDSEKKKLTPDAAPSPPPTGTSP